MNFRTFFLGAVLCLLIPGLGFSQASDEQAEHDQAYNPPRGIVDAIALQAPEAEFRALARSVAEGKATGPMRRAYLWLYPRLYPFETPVSPTWKKEALDAASSHPNVWIQAAQTLKTRLGQRQPSLSVTGSWSSVGPGNIPGRMSCLAQDPSTPSTLYGGAAAGGVWKTTDGGANWVPLTDFEVNLSMGAIAIDPTDSNIIYAGTGEGNFGNNYYAGAGVMKSTDAGVNWTLGPYFSPEVRCFAIDPTNTQKIFATGDGLHLTLNGGTSWNLVGGGLPAADEEAVDVRMDPTNPLILYVSFGIQADDPGNGVYKSIDGGASWTKLGGGLPTVNEGYTSLAIAPSNTDVLYASVADTSTNQILDVYRSADAGASWSALGKANFCGGQCTYNNEVIVDPLDPDTVYVGGLNVQQSTNGGSNWSVISNWQATPGASDYVHADVHAFIAPAANELIVGTDGGVSWTTNAGSTWSWVVGGFETSQFYGVATHPTDPDVMYAGMQDNCLCKYTGLLNGWEEEVFGDGLYARIDFNTPDTVYIEMPFLDIRKSTNAGGTWQSKSNGISGSDRMHPIAPFVMDPTDPETLYAGTYRVYKTTNGAGNGPNGWDAISGDITDGTSTGLLWCMNVSPVNNQTVWSGTWHGRVNVSTDGGSNWTNVTAAPLPNLTVNAVIPHPTDVNTAYAVFSGYGSGHVFRTTDLGANWTDVSSNLPDLPMSHLWIDPATPATVVVGTDIGVYRSDDSAATWYKWSNGLPNTPITEFTFAPAQNLLRIATHGRGIWEFTASAGGTLKPAPDGLNVAGTPMTVGKNGADADIDWDVSTCPSDDYMLVWGDMADIASYTYSTSECGLGVSGAATVTPPAGSAFFYLVGTDGVNVESVHGWDSSGTAVSGSGVGLCGIASQNGSASCP